MTFGGLTMKMTKTFTRFSIATARILAMVMTIRMTLTIFSRSYRIAAEIWCGQDQMLRILNRVWVWRPAECKNTLAVMSYPVPDQLFLLRCYDSFHFLDFTFYFFHTVTRVLLPFHVLLILYVDWRIYRIMHYRIIHLVFVSSSHFSEGLRSIFHRPW